MTDEVEHYLKNIRQFFLCIFWLISSHFFPYGAAEDFIGAGGDNVPFSWQGEGGWSLEKTVDVKEENWRKTEAGDF